MMPLFRRVALIEGITTILLFLVAMPLKYIAGWPHLVPLVGWLHGIAFLAYLNVMILAFGEAGVRPMGWLRGFVASLVPFGTFANAGYVRRSGSSTRG